ncbi:MAG TPA: WG repeat-containing protein [Spirochaetota bacterium]|nr:WG repeat-containing protein [Spirochaetota bacterium]
MKRIFFIIILIILPAIIVLHNTGIKADENKNIIWLVKPQFDYASSFHENFARIQINGKWGFINNKGEMVVKPQYVWVTDYHKGYAQIKSKNGLWFFINKEGNIFADMKHPPSVYDPKDYFCINRSVGGKDIEWGFIYFKYDFWVVEECRYHIREVKDSHNGFTPIKINGKWGFINRKGRVVIAPRFDRVMDFHEGLARFQKDGMWGFINRKGRVVIEPRFDRVMDFHEGLARFQKDGKWGFINRKGRMVIEPRFEWVIDFHEGFACIKKNKKWGFIRNPIKARQR